VVRRWIEAYGVPLALYTDWKNVYVREPNAEEQATGAVPLTQFGCMCAALGMQIIAASSPQAKGRVERNHGTHQDRLVKKLRRLGIADDRAANVFLETTYLPDHNARFAQSSCFGTTVGGNPWPRFRRCWDSEPRAPRHHISASGALGTWRLIRRDPNI